MITVYNMDVIKALQQMPDESVDMQICSPPYWGLRSYGKDVEIDWGDGYIGELGLEPDFNLYIKHLCDIFDEVKRVLKKEGICFVNLSDTYFGGNLGVGQPKDYKSISTDNKGTGFDTEQMKDFVKQRKQMVYKPKCLCAIPERFMIEMINRGWILRNKIIWFKRNHMPTSVKDRFANSWEYLFMFSKSQKYYFDLDAVREPHKTESIQRTKHKWEGHREPGSSYAQMDINKMCHPKGKNPGDIIQSQSEIPKEDSIKFGSPIARNYRKYETGYEGGKVMKKAPNPDQPNAFYPLGKNPSDTWKDNLRDDERAKKAREQGMNTFYSHSKRQKSKFKHANDFWDITTQGYKEAHFAVFPKALVEKPIKTTSKNAVIMDIFAGSGTSLEVARDLGRDAIGIEIKKEYCKLIEKRLFKENTPLFNNEFKIIENSLA